MYTVDGKPFDSFFAAIAAADKAKTVVIEATTGQVRWRPGTVSATAAKRYQERVAAYRAQEEERHG